MTSPTVGGEAVAPLTGFAVLLTADRRAAEWRAGLEQLGAEVQHAPALRIEPIGAGQDLVRSTLDVIDNPPDEVLITTAIGLRGWVEAAEVVGLGTGLLHVLSKARLRARGPKARGAALALGLTVSDFVEAGETSVRLADQLIEEGIAGRRVVVQEHGRPDAALTQRLTAAGATVRTIRVYRWGDSPDPSALDRGIAGVAGRTVDAVVFVSTPGVLAFLDAARRGGRYDDVIAAFGDDVTAAAVGPMTATSLRAAGVVSIYPDRFRIGALIRELSEHLVSQRVATVRVADGGELQLRGRMVILDGHRLMLPPGPLAVLRSLVRNPGGVVSRERLLDVLPGAGTDPHAVEVAVARLRSGLGRPGVVATVFKRGYRLDVPHH